jgi:hypothetical protein
VTGAELRRLLHSLGDSLEDAARMASKRSSDAAAAEDQDLSRQWRVTASILNDADTSLAELLGTPGLVDFLAVVTAPPAPVDAPAPRTAP